jgi:6-phosphogluconolactonase (cycloisomerase 2 family)
VARSLHTPDRSLFTGKDRRGNYQFATLATDGSYWHHTTIWADGSDGVCDCEGYRRHGHCTLTDNSAHLVARTDLEEEAHRLMDLAAGLRYNHLIDREEDRGAKDPTK